MKAVDNPYTRLHATSYTPEVLRALKILAAEEECSVSAIVRRAVERELALHADTEPPPPTKGDAR